MAKAQEPQQVSDDDARHADRLGRVYLTVVLVAAVLAILVPAIAFRGDSRVFLLKVVTAALLSFLPGWLYLQFIKNKGQSLYDEYVLNLFRLHIDEYRNLPMPPQHTSYFALWKEEHQQLRTQTKDNLYRKKFEAIYGRSAVSTANAIYGRPVRDRAETFSPVLFATLVLCLGWVLVLQPEFYRGFDVFGDLGLSRRPELPTEALQFGFIGAYSFILQDLIRRYFRDDLKTGAYISAAARVIFVTLVVTAVDLIWPVRATDQEHVFAFLIGFFPQVGLQALQAALSKPLGSLIPSLRTDYPLSKLEGLNVWYEARLAEEGIEDMQNLASANIVDLLLRSRVPIGRLVDWMDQAFLCLYLPALGGKPPSPSREKLRRLGIRTATDLHRAWSRVRHEPAFCKSISDALEVPHEVGPSVVEAMLASMEGETNLWHVQEFKRHDWLLGDAGTGLANPAPAVTSMQPDPAPA